MPADFSLSPELEDIRQRTRDFIENVVSDTPLADLYLHARWARFADGADEIHQMRIAQRTITADRDTGSTRTATGDLPL